MYFHLYEGGRWPMLVFFSYVLIVLPLLTTDSEAALIDYRAKEEHEPLTRRIPLPITSENFVRFAYHASAVTGETLVLNGGEINWKTTNDSSHEISNTIFAVLRTVSNGEVNYTLTIDLSNSWTPENAVINALVRNEAPNRAMGLLWVDSDNTVFSFGGSRSLILNESISTNGGSELWKFTGSNWSQVLDSSSPDSPTLTHISPAWAASAWAHGTGYALGGYVGDNRHSSNGNLVVPTTGLLSYNSTSNVWSNDSTAPALTPYGLMGGQMLSAPGFGADGVLIAFGGQFTGPGSWSNTGENFIPFSNISVYDIASKSWFWQAATGSTGPTDIPPSRTFFCAAGIQSNQSTYEIFVYGGFDDTFVSGTSNPSSGDNANQASFNIAYILSLPAFVWFKINDTSAEPRTQHKCNVAGNRQVISVGGINPTVQYPDYFTQTDSWAQGLGVFDMVDLKWTNTYDAGAAAYTLPSVLQDWYNQPNSNSSIQWTNGEVRSLFLSNSSSAPPSAPTASAPANVSSTPSLPVGAIAAIVIGGIAFIAFIVILILLSRRRRRSKTREKLTQHQDVWHIKPELESRKRPVNAGLHELFVSLRGELGGTPLNEASSTPIHELPSTPR